MTSEQQSLSEVKDDSDTSASQGYEEVALSEVVDPVLGKTPRRKNDDYWQGDIKWASAKDISQNDTRKIYDTVEYMTAEGKNASNAKKMPEGTLVVIARGATMGRSAQLGEPMTFNQTCYGLDADNNKLLDDFLYYIWQYRFNQIQSVSHGTVFDTITMDSFKDIDIPLPTLEIQKKVSKVLTDIDNKIETNNRINEILEEMAQAIFRSWFIDYEPFSDQEFEYHDAIGEEIPQDWDIKQMSQIARTVDCLHSKKPDKQDEGRFYIEVNDIGESGELQLDDKYLISEKEYKEWTRRITAKGGDVIISKTGRVGAVAQIPEGIEGAIGRNIVCIRPATEELSPAFLKEYMISPLMRQEIGRKTLSGTVLESLHVKEIENLRVVVPPKDVRERFEETVGRLHTRINHNIKENENLKQVRDTLLPKLMSGEIRANDIELDELGVDSEV